MSVVVHTRSATGHIKVRIYDEAHHAITGWWKYKSLVDIMPRLCTANTNLSHLRAIEWGILNTFRPNKSYHNFKRISFDEYVDRWTTNIIIIDRSIKIKLVLTMSCRGFKPFVNGLVAIVYKTHWRYFIPLGVLLFVPNFVYDKHPYLGV